MKLFHLFGAKAKEASSKTEEKQEAEMLMVYSGMRVEVATVKGRLLFVAKLEDLEGDRAELHQYSESEGFQSEEPILVKIRGYNEHEKKAVYIDGTITPKPQHIWLLEGLTVTGMENDRAFFRLGTNLDATATKFSGLEMGERTCKLLNISVGGACIGSERRYHKGDRFLLKVKLLEDRPVSAMFCEVLRVTETRHGKFEYGCKFLELTEEDQEKIIQSIFEVQRQKRSRY